jgi:hypothetical protein
MTAATVRAAANTVHYTTIGTAADMVTGKTESAMEWRLTAECSRRRVAPQGSCEQSESDIHGCVVGECNVRAGG